jgi:LytS/YehU family sensor histidine kinase
MRQTLDNSSQPVISISREINYMESYLKLEQMRFPSKFRFEINIDKDIEMDQLFVPSLFLQPFAENSIRHGIRHKREQNGFVKINIVQRDGHIICSVEDNGVGREVASQYKTVRHIEYQSKGIKLTLDRLNILTGDNKEKVGFQITDLADDKGKATGTKVTIDFPISIISKLSER